MQPHRLFRKFASADYIFVMAGDDWYRNKTWNKEIETAFKLRLNRSRGLYNRTEYLRIQGSYLLSSCDPVIQAAGLEMLDELIGNYPDVNGVIVNKFDAFVQLGDYYYQRELWEEAFVNYQKAISYDKRLTHGQDHAYRGFIKSAVLSKHEDAYSLGLNYLDNHDPQSLIFLSEIADHSIASAMLNEATGNHNAAKEYASAALRTLNTESTLHEKDEPFVTEREAAFLTNLLRLP